MVGAARSAFPRQKSPAQTKSTRRDKADRAVDDGFIQGLAMLSYELSRPGYKTSGLVCPRLLYSGEVRYKYIPDGSRDLALNRWPHV